MSAPRCVPSLATPGLLALAPPGLLTLAALGFLALAAPAAMAWSTGPTFDCSSNDRRTVHCPVDTRGGVVLLRQHSRAPCIEGDSWGWDRRGVWVSHGCRAEFESAGPGGGPGWGHGPGPGWGGGPGWAPPPQTVRCESSRGRVQYCAVGPVRSIRLQRQLSRGECREGYSWGWDRGMLWVSHGCRGEFVVW